MPEVDRVSDGEGGVIPNEVFRIELVEPQELGIMLFVKPLFLLRALGLGQVLQRLDPAVGDGLEGAADGLPLRHLQSVSGENLAEAPGRVADVVVGSLVQLAQQRLEDVARAAGLKEACELGEHPFLIGDVVHDVGHEQQVGARGG